jgi:hypothetical protein
VICGDAADGSAMRAELNGPAAAAQGLKSCAGAFPCAFVPPGQAGIAGELKSGQVLLLSPDGKTKLDCGPLQRQKDESYGACLIRLLNSEGRLAQAWRERRPDPSLQKEMKEQVAALGGAARQRREARKWLTEHLGDAGPMLLASINDEDPETAASAREILASASSRDISGLPALIQRGNMDPRIACGMARISPLAGIYLNRRKA